MWFIVAAICWNLLLPSNGQHSTPIVNIQGLGSVQGSIGHTTWTNRTIYQFKGIPYAQAPIGNLRFQPPVKRPGWTGTLDVSQPSVHCPQITDEYTNVENEDCLTLSVYSNNLDEVRPVMVYIHGGWFFIGGANDYQPNYLLESDIVLVVIQYRLGPLGFLSLLNERIPGNAGILDTIMALEWVQQYIGHFGGNANQVTVFGESAGSAAVSALLHSPLVQNRPVPLFQRAILQSGSVFAPWAMCDATVQGSMDIARRTGCTDEATVEQCLQQAPLINLLQAFENHRTETIKSNGYPSVAGTCLVVGGPSGLFPQHPKHYLGSATKNVAVMAGTTSQDGMFLLDEIAKLQPESLHTAKTSYGVMQFIRMLQEKFGQTKLDGTLEGYQIMGTFLKSEIDQAQWKNVVPGLIDICGSHGIKGPVLTDVHAISAVNPENVYLYSFDFDSERPKSDQSFPFPHKGAVDHAEDLFYLFPLTTLNDRETKMAKTMVRLWSSFATAGIPSARDVPYWPPADRLYGPYLKINEVFEQRNYYLNEFSATSDKYRTYGRGCSQCGISVMTIILLVVISMVLS
uniref:Carboxylic ester hydrolase n=1 Tax=Culex tarsalis TaxID=7177 RepID=A0A1Q3FP68_CULTA